MKRVRTILRGCRFDSLSDLEAAAIQTFLDRFVKEHKLGAKTFNHYVQAVVAFGNWLKEVGRIRSNPFEKVKRRKVSTDIRRKRRSLNPAEMGLLVMSALESDERVQGYDGQERSRAYLLSYLTGLRQNEVPRVTRQVMTRRDVTLTCVTTRKATIQNRPRKPEVLTLPGITSQGMATRVTIP